MAMTAVVRVERMSIADIPAVHRIERRSFSTPWPQNAFEQELTGNRMAHYIVARAGSEVAGYAGLWLIVEEGHITTFGVDPAWRRLGIGLQMLLTLADLSIRIGAAHMTLEVRASNEPAKALYAKFGFTETGVRPAYYTDNGEDAIVMATPPLRDPAQQQIMARVRAALADRPHLQ